MTDRKQAGFFHKRTDDHFGGVIFDLDGKTNQPYGNSRPNWRKRPA